MSKLTHCESKCVRLWVGRVDALDPLRRTLGAARAGMGLWGSLPRQLSSAVLISEGLSSFSGFYFPVANNFQRRMSRLEQR